MIKREKDQSPSRRLNQKDHGLNLTYQKLKYLRTSVKRKTHKIKLT